MLGQLPLFASGGTLDPTTMLLTGFWRSYVNPSWPGTASFGVSGDGSHDWNDPGNEPAQGTALNGFGTADFNGTNDYLTSDGITGDYLGTNAFSGWFLVRPDSVAVGTIFYAGSGELRLRLTGGNASLAITGGVATVTRAISSGQYSLITFRYDDVNVQIGVNEPPGAAGGGSSAAHTAFLPSLNGMIMGRDSAATDWYDGHVAEAVLTNTVLTDSQIRSIIRYINKRYALSL